METVYVMFEEWLAERYPVLDDIVKSRRMRYAITPKLADEIKEYCKDAYAAGAAFTPEAAGRGDDRLMHELWVQGSRLRNELRDALVLHPENWHVPAVEQRLEQWDAIAGRYAQRFAAPPSAEQAAVPETKD